MTILRLAAWALGAVVCDRTVENHWVVGPVFGGVVVLWDWTCCQKPRWVRWGVFLVVSTLIYAMVRELADIRLPDSPIFEVLFPAVLVGSFLLPLAHRIILNQPRVPIVTTGILIYIASYAGSLVSDGLGLGAPWTMLINSVAAWQGAYLFLLFREK
jgi:hypothetical protein